MTDSVASDHNTVSTVQSENLNELWKLLDEKNPILSEDSKPNLKLNGVRMGQSKSKVVNPKKIAIASKSNPVRTKPRNYNIKDD